MSSSTALVSVITPAYNVAPWIGEAIDSVLAQTERRFEYVVVDDGSTDDTAEIVREKARTDDRIRLICSTNAGSGTARNIGLDETNARFVAFLDGDDRWDSNFLHRQFETMHQAPPGVGVTFCHTRVMLEGGQVVGLRWQPTGTFDIDRLLVDNNPPHNGSSLLIRRSCFAECGYFDTDIASAVDFDMWLRIAAKSATPYFWGFRRYLVDMRLMRTGSISSNRVARFRALDAMLAEYTPMMGRLHPGLAYVRPAVFAYRDGFDDFGDCWAAQARAAGTRKLAAGMWGQSLLTWSQAGPAGRAALRAARDRTRAGVYKSAAQAAKLVPSRA